jgi:hypothetical protein
LGDVDLLGEVKGIGSYDDLVPQSITVDFEGFPTKLLSIRSLIIAKEAAGRLKDQPGLQVLYALQESESEGA